MAQSAPHGARALLASVEADARRGWPPGLTVLTGDDTYHLDRAQRAILRSLVDDLDPAFGRTVYGDEKIDVAAVVAAARSIGMFAPRRVVFVRDVSALVADDDTLPALTDYAGAPPRSSHLIVRAPALDLRRKLHKALAQSGRLLEFALAEGEGKLVVARQVLAEVSRERGVRLAPDAAQLLVELTAGDLERIEHELDKIAAWTADAKAVVEAPVVLEVAAGSGLVSGWAAAEALTRRDRPAALVALRRNLDAGEAPLRILGSLSFRARVLLQAKALSEARRPLNEIFSLVRAWGRTKDDLAHGLPRYRPDEVLGFPAKLLAADRALKSSALGPEATLESLADRLLGDGR
jgi:DNA polymerase III subunit delta